VLLAVLAQILAVRVDDRRGVVIDAADLLFVERHHDRHAVLLGDLTHQVRGRPGDQLRGGVPALVLAGAEVRPVEDLLQAEDLRALLRGLLDQRQMLVEHRLLDLLHRHRLVVDRVAALNESCAD
jgi:hypothetical protein